MYSNKIIIIAIYFFLVMVFDVGVVGVGEVTHSGVGGPQGQYRTLALNSTQVCCGNFVGSTTFEGVFMWGDMDMCGWSALVFALCAHMRPCILH